MAEIIGAEDGFRAKPEPDMFEEFLRRTKLSKQQVIYVGDTPVDIKGSIN
jgi:HAD superfamily hydrolase (TIGR01549 family)